MGKFVITTENTSDMPKAYFEQHGIPRMYLPCTMDEIVYTGENELPYKEFYDRMRTGSMPVTSQVNSEDARKEWTAFVEAGKEILHVAFSSGLSGTYNSCRMAAEEMREEYPGCKIIVVDSLCASIGEGLLLDKAVKMRDEGKSLEETAQWLEEHKLELAHMVTVDDLFHLHRGGRVSKVSAVLGSMINIKPIIHVDKDGRLTVVDKVRGRKRSLMTLVDMMEERLKDYDGPREKFFISHGDCEEDAMFVVKLVQERLGYKEFLMNPVGATIGAHTGAGVIALCFFGNYR